MCQMASALGKRNKKRKRWIESKRKLPDFEWMKMCKMNNLICTLHWIHAKIINQPIVSN